MKTIILYLFLFSCYLTLNAQFQQVGSSINGKKSQDNFGESISLNGVGDILAVGTPSNDSAGTNAGCVKIYKRVNNEWEQLGKTLFGLSSYDLFGNSVSISKNGLIIAIGAKQSEGGGTLRGSVYVYQYLNNEWELMGSEINGENDNDNFGFSVDLSDDGTKIIAGAPNNNGNNSQSGQARVFEFKNNQWTQLGSSIYGEDIGDYGGRTVSINSTGDVIAFSLPNNKGVTGGYGRGKIKLYSLVNNDWAQIGNGIVGEANFDAIGTSISLSSNGEKIAISSFIKSGSSINKGQTRIFELTMTGWSQLGQSINGESDYDYSGNSISLSDDGLTIAIGASINDADDINSNKGHVRVFKFESGNWIQFGEDIDGMMNAEQFGNAVSLSSNGQILAAAAWKNSSVSLEAGQVRIYQNNTPQSSIHQNSLNKIKLWPNPTNEFLYLENINEVKQILIHNTLGIEVLNLNTFENGLNKIDLRFLNNGIYYMTIIQNDKIITEKINLIK